MHRKKLRKSKFWKENLVTRMDIGFIKFPIFYYAQAYKYKTYAYISGHSDKNILGTNLYIAQNGEVFKEKKERLILRPCAAPTWPGYASNSQENNNMNREPIKGHAAGPTKI
jgi:hypothetical protein